MKKIAIRTTCEQTLADMVTPVGIYLRLRDRFRDTILLESADFHTAENSWSFIGVNAIAGFEAIDLQTVEFKLPGMPPEKIPLGSPADLVPAFNAFLERFEPQGDRGLKAAQSFFGYTSFDAVQFFDSIRFNANKESTTASHLMRYRLYQYVIAINHFKDELYICENKFAGLEGDIDLVRSLIHSKDVPVFPFATEGPVSSNMTDEAYREMVKKGIASCHRGDVFQIVLSRRFAQPFRGDEFNVYRALRSVNPSPYLFYFDYGDYRLFGSSPESQLIIDKGQAVVHPIAGTFKRTGDDATDMAEAERLVNDAKENAEHVMLVDLARNDLSRHADDVTVTSYRKVHYYSHVIHLVSEVTGKVKEGVQPFDIMSDTFPAGTLSGAPKYKAMQLIDEMEPTARGYYGGAVGIIGLDGSFNHAIMIRTFMSRNNHLYCQAGAGVVAKSIPENELQEVNNKLGALN
ncbi:MAG TPA: anthranilate synthase component I family protein, partial [Phnomibacter sp.]|nr:anthranilate synthase component I family protein [Phnomibacter sp.]